MAKGTTAKKFINDFFAIVGRKITFEQTVRAEEFFVTVRDYTLDQIRNHPVSQELINHTNPSPILGTRGTLYGFLGFVQGTEPVEEILEITRKIMDYRLTRTLKIGALKLTIIIPTAEDFRTPGLELPWEGGHSLVEGVEKGISGLSNYVLNRNLAYSRSTEGVQNKNPVRQKDFAGTPYLTPIFAKIQNVARKFPFGTPVKSLK